MFFQYETPRLLLKVLRADCAPQVLDFYNRDKELFEMYKDVDDEKLFENLKYFLEKIFSFASSSATSSLVFPNTVSSNITG